jgi:hypothetical protein
MINALHHSTFQQELYEFLSLIRFFQTEDRNAAQKGLQKVLTGI